MQDLTREEVLSDSYVTAIHELNRLRRKWGPRRLDHIAADMRINKERLRITWCLLEAIRRTRPWRSSQRTGIRELYSFLLHGGEKYPHAPASLEGADLRTAREALHAAAWLGLRRRERVIALLRGRELELHLRESAEYEEDVLLSDDEQDIFMRAVRSLPDTEDLNEDVMQTTAGKLNTLARSLRQGKDADLSLRVRKIASFRAEALQWMTVTNNGRRTRERRLAMTHAVDAIGQEANVRLHPIAQRVLRDAFVDEHCMAEEGLKPFRALVPEEFGTALRCRETRALLEAMREPDEDLATRLIENFGSARRCLHATERDVAVIVDDVRLVMERVHGHDAEMHAALGNGRWLICRVLVDRFGTLAGARMADFAEFVGSSEEVATIRMDERLNVYERVHSDSDGEPRRRFESSWMLFKAVCMKTRADNAVAVTAQLLAQGEHGSAVLRRVMSDEACVYACHTSPGAGAVVRVATLHVFTMERHPAGCDPAEFRNFATPRAGAPLSPPRRRSVPAHAPTSPTHDDLLPLSDLDISLIPGLYIAVDAVCASADHEGSHSNPYKRPQYPDRLKRAVDQLVTLFVSHLNDCRAQSPALHRSSRRLTVPKRAPRGVVESGGYHLRHRPSHRDRPKRPRTRLYPIEIDSEDESESDDHDRSSEDDGNEAPRKEPRPRRSKEIRSNLNDDLAYELMANRSRTPDPAPQHASPQKFVIDDSEDESMDSDSITLPVVRPLQAVRRRPLTSDYDSMTPFCADDDESTDTERERRAVARRPLKHILGTGHQEFTHQELFSIFPDQHSKRRLKRDSLVIVPKGKSKATVPSKPHIVVLDPIPAEMTAKYIGGVSSRLSPDAVLASLDQVVEETNDLSSKLLPDLPHLQAKRRSLSSDGDTLVVDSSIASLATNLHSSSSTTGSPQLKATGPANGHSEFSNNTEKQETPESNQVSRSALQANRKTRYSFPFGRLAWKDSAPYGKKHVSGIASTTLINGRDMHNVSLIPKSVQKMHVKTPRLTDPPVHSQAVVPAMRLQVGAHMRNVGPSPHHPMPVASMSRSSPRATQIEMQREMTVPSQVNQQKASAAFPGSNSVSTSGHQGNHGTRQFAPFVLASQNRMSFPQGQHQTGNLHHPSGVSRMPSSVVQMPIMQTPGQGIMGMHGRYAANLGGNAMTASVIRPRNVEGPSAGGGLGSMGNQNSRIAPGLLREGQDGTAKELTVQLQEQYKKRYGEMYNRHYDEEMKSLQRAQSDRSKP